MLQPGEGERLHVLAERATFKVTAADGVGALSLLELECPPGGGVPPHTHAADHVLYVLAGTFALASGARSEMLPPGACAVVPGGIEHGYVNVDGVPGRLLVIATPPAEPDRVFLELAARLALGHAGSPAMAAVVRVLGARHDLGLSKPGAR